MLEAVMVVNDMLNIDSDITTDGDELKCYIPDRPYGGVHKTYLSAEDCKGLAEAFLFISRRLSGTG